MYLCLYVHELLTHFLTDLLQTGIKISQFFPRLTSQIRFFILPPGGQAGMKISVFFSFSDLHAFVCVESIFAILQKDRGGQDGQERFCRIFV